MPIMRIEQAEFARMRSWFGYMAPRVFPPDLLTPETDPIAVLDRLVSRSPAQARSGLAMAIGDVVEFTSDWPLAQLANCDGELAQRGLPTLTQVQARFSKMVQRVARRGRITCDEEFHALRNAVDLQRANADTLWPLLAAYETRGTGV